MVAGGELEFLARDIGARRTAFHSCRPLLEPVPQQDAEGLDAFDVDPRRLRHLLANLGASVLTLLQRVLVFPESDEVGSAVLPVAQDDDPAVPVELTYPR